MSQPMIQSQNSLFKGEWFPKPPPALVVGTDPDGWDIYACPKCGHQASMMDLDCIGAEPGCYFCRKCNTEFDGDVIQEAK